MKTIMSLCLGLFIGYAASGLMAGAATTDDQTSVVALKAQVASLKQVVEESKSDLATRVDNLEKQTGELSQRLESIESGEGKQVPVGEPRIIR